MSPITHNTALFNPFSHDTIEGLSSCNHFSSLHPADSGHHILPFPDRCKELQISLTLFYRQSFNSCELLHWHSPPDLPGPTLVVSKCEQGSKSPRILSWYNLLDLESVDVGENCISYISPVPRWWGCHWSGNNTFRTTTYKKTNPNQRVIDFCSSTKDLQKPWDECVSFTSSAHFRKWCHSV